MRKVVVAGATGYLGRALVQDLSRDYDVLALSRTGNPVLGSRSSAWDGASVESLALHLVGAHAMVNLIGEPVNQRWTPAVKDRILQSRVDSTKAIASALTGIGAAITWVNGSATGYYGETGDREVDESSPPGTGFLADVCQAWEAACLEPNLPRVRRLVVRTGVVLGPDGGVLAPLVKLAKFFLGGSVGSGSQYVPWVSLEDEIGILRMCLDRDVHGPINAVSPQPATQAELMRELRQALHRPWAPPVPAFAVKLAGALIGMPAEVALESCRVRPSVALDLGFEWRQSELASAVRLAV